MPDCKIRILPEEVASKIAAGEVIERPASVVKELLENSVDSGATRIVVDVEEGGRALIRVADNGSGMTAQEAVLSLQRHATSKITRADDLALVRTLGFRGEALPSIASVSRVTVLTRARGDAEGGEGVRMEAEGGEIRELEPAAAAEGTTITVRDLFFNTPARLKFLKTTRTELGQICDTVTRLALSHPEISLRLIADGSEVLHSPGSTDPLNSLTALYGADTARELIPVAHAGGPLAVEGYISRPSFTRPTRSGQHLFVNGRWIRNRTLIHAVDEAYRASVPARRFPFVVLHLEIDPALVDVNVHPAKTEIRFLRDWEVHRAMVEAVRAALAETAMGPVTTSLARQHALSPEALRHGSWLPPAPEQPPAAVDPEDPFAGPDPGATPPAPAPRRAPDTARQPALPELETPLRALRLVSQLWDSYLVAEGPTGLIVIDQHLAHERILFERLRAPGDERPERPVTAPMTLQLTHREALLIDEAVPELNALGFDLEAFGRDAFVVRSVSRFVSPGAELTTLRMLVDDLMESRRSGSPHAPAAERLAIATACRTAVKKGVRLGAEEMRRLLADLAKTSNPHTCPHGCPITIEISYQELLKRFKRI